jgi:hypothetical protein
VGLRGRDYCNRRSIVLSGLLSEISEWYLELRGPTIEKLCWWPLRMLSGESAVHLMTFAKGPERGLSLTTSSAYHLMAR